MDEHESVNPEEFKVNWTNYTPIICIDIGLFLVGTLCIVYPPSGDSTQRSLIISLGSILLLMGVLVLMLLLFMYSILRHKGTIITGVDGEKYVEFVDNNDNVVGTYKLGGNRDDIHPYSPQGYSWWTGKPRE